MKFKMLSVLSLSGVLALAAQSQANTVNFSFTGTGVSGSGVLTYTPQMGGTDPITDISGTFTDTNTGNNSKPSIVNATITGLHAIAPISPLPTGVLNAADFSQYSVANGIIGADQPSNALSYDNTFYGSGSPVVCAGYPLSGGNLDVYGVLFDISSNSQNYVVDLWSNGAFGGGPNPTYGVALADSTYSYDYVGDVAANVPEPGMLSLMGIALGGMALIRRRKPAAA